MFCKNCGSQLNDNAKFCGKCGTRVNSNERIDFDNVSNSLDDWSEGGDDKKAAKNSAMMQLIIVGIVVLLIILVVLVSVILHNQKSKAEADYEDVPEIDYYEEMESETEDSVADDVLATEESVVNEEDFEQTFDTTEVGSEDGFVDDLGIHQYEFVIADVSYEQAKALASGKGGYLARINSEEEFSYITAMLSGEEYDKIHFYLNGNRDPYGIDYYWNDNNGNHFGDPVNDYNNWSVGKWYENEPSYIDSVEDVEIQENTINLFKVNGTWYLNDTSDDLIGNYSFFSGQVGYIVEYE